MNRSEKVHHERDKAPQAHVDSKDRASGEIQYLTTTEASRFTRLSVSTLAKLRVYGGGPKYIKAGSKVLYRAEELDSWMASRERTHTSEA